MTRRHLFRIRPLHKLRASIIVIGRFAANCLHLDRSILCIVVKLGYIALGARALRGWLVTASEGVHAADQPDFRLLIVNKFIITSRWGRVLIQLQLLLLPKMLLIMILWGTPVLLLLVIRTASIVVKRAEHSFIFLAIGIQHVITRWVSRRIFYRIIIVILMTAALLLQLKPSLVVLTL